MISIIVPVYNNESYIGKCIESIINQTYSEIEIIIVNDGSTDDTERIVKEYRQKDERIKLYTIDNAGVSNARNFGISKAVGEYIGFVDSDDYIQKNMYEVLLENMDDSVQMVCCKACLKKDIGVEEESNFPKTGKYTNIEMVKFLSEGNPKIEGTVWRGLFKRSIIIEKLIDFKKIKIYEDILFLIEYLKYIEYIKVLDEPLYIYNKTNEDSAVFNLNSKRYVKDFVKFPKMLNEVVKGSNLEQIMEKRLIITYIYTAIRLRNVLNYKDFKAICKEYKISEQVNKKQLKLITNIKFNV